MLNDVFEEAHEIRSEMRASHLEGAPEFEAISALIAEAEAAEDRIRKRWNSLKQRVTGRIRRIWASQTQYLNDEYAPASLEQLNTCGPARWEPESENTS